MSILAVWTLTEVWQRRIAPERRPGPGRSRPGSAADWPSWRARPGWRSWRRPGLFAPSLTAAGGSARSLLWGASPSSGMPALGLGDPARIWIDHFIRTQYFEYNFSWTVHHYEKGNTLALAVLHAGEPAGDRPGQDQVALDHRRLLDHDRGAADRRWASGGGSRRAMGRGRETDLLVATICRGLRAGDAQERRRRDPGRPARALLFAGLCAGAADAVAGMIEWLGLAGGSRAQSSRGCRRLLVAWSGPTRPGPTTRRGWPNRFSFTGRRCARRASGSQAHPTWCLPTARIMTWFPWELRVTSDRTTVLMPRNYNPRRIQEVIRQYGVTHFLWGSFEPPPYYEINPESWATRARAAPRSSSV